MTIKPYYQSDRVTLYHGDCREVMASLDAVDAVVTDPPYGLSFMGKHWDYDVPGVEVWADCLRALKPGGHLLAFAGTRTQHRMAVNIEDAGFDIRDMIAWVYGSGFPKSHNLDGKWSGWGTALKPAMEPITVARKPLDGTVADNVQEWGTGAINVDGCRVGTDTVEKSGLRNGTGNALNWSKSTTPNGWRGSSHAGRWPANLIHDGGDEVLAVFPSTGKSAGGSRGAGGKHGRYSAIGAQPEIGPLGYGDTGSAARFFYCPKASKADRDEGCEGLAEHVALIGAEGHKINPMTGRPVVDLPRRNHHPTVKPTDLMRYLCRLVTPPGGVVLDPFCGSGSTGKAAMLEGFHFIGIDREEAYCEIAANRIQAAERECAERLVQA